MPWRTVAAANDSLRPNVFLGRVARLKRSAFSDTRWPLRQLQRNSAAIAQKFQGYKVVETQTVQRWDETRLIYEVHLENAVEIVKLQLYADGTILNKSAKEKRRRRE